MAETVYECEASTYYHTGGGNLGTSPIVVAGNIKLPTIDLMLRTLLRFDLTGTPPNWRRARLQLTVQDMAIEETTVFYAQKITQPAWTELGARWIKYDGTNQWLTFGGDVTGEIVNIGLVSPGDTHLVLDVRPWALDAEGGMLNLMIRGQVEGRGGVDRWVAFHSSRATNALDRPLLMLEDYPSQATDKFFW